MSKKHIEECVRASLEQYFKDLRGAEPHSVHDMVIHTVEKPMLDVVMRQAEGNQQCGDNVDLLHGGTVSHPTCEVNRV